MSTPSIDPQRIERVSKALTAAMAAGNRDPYSLAFALEVAGLLATPAVTDLAEAVDLLGALPMPAGEDPHDSPLHHAYALGRELPEVPVQQNRRSL